MREKIPQFCFLLVACLLWWSLPFLCWLGVVGIIVCVVLIFGCYTLSLGNRDSPVIVVLWIPVMVFFALSIIAAICYALYLGFVVLVEPPWKNVPPNDIGEAELAFVALLIMGIPVLLLGILSLVAFLFGIRYRPKHYPIDLSVISATNICLVIGLVFIKPILFS